MLLIASAVAGFACLQPKHHDGDAIRCAGSRRSDRLYGIDAPEMPGACRPGRRCTPGDPHAARDHLAALTSGRNVTCSQVDSDFYGRRIVRCAAGGEDLSCAMVASEFAVRRYGRLDCDRPEGAERSAINARCALPPILENTAISPGEGAIGQGRSIWGIALAVWLLLANIAAWAAFAIDRHRATAGLSRRVMRIPEGRLLALAAIGGSIGAIAAQQLLRHKTRKQPFARRLLLIAGFQAGIVLGLIALTLV